MNVEKLSNDQIQSELERLAEKDNLVWNEQIYYERLLGRSGAIKARQHLDNMFDSMFPSNKEKPAF